MSAIGILITYYNEGPLLTECLESLRDAECMPDEIWVYDDASTKPPGPFIPAGMSVSVVRGDANHGPAHGRNSLLEACTCEYVHFHDADDLFAPGWCSEVRAHLKEKPLDVLFTEVSSYRDGQLLQERVIGLDQLAVDPDLVRFCIRNAILIGSGTYKRERILAAGGYSTDYWQSEDYEFHIRLANSGLRYGVIPRPLSRIRSRPDSRSKDAVRVWVDGGRALNQLAEQLGPQHAQDVCDHQAKIGSKLYKLDALREAREAFACAYRFGRPRFSGQSRLYREVAKVFGPIMAERVGWLYRSLLPAAVRGRVRASQE